MTVVHSTITDPNIHEPKGAGSASANTTYISNGSGSGTWQKVGPSQIQNVNNLNKINLTYTFNDISTAGSQWVVCPIAGDIANIYSVIDGAITGANCGFTFEIAGTAVTDGAITITQSGSAAGDVDSSTPSAANTLSAGQAIEIISDGASTGAVSATFTFVIDVT